MIVPRLVTAQGTLVGVRAGAVGVLVLQDTPLFEAAGRALRRYFDGPPPLFGSDAFRGKEGESIVLSPAALDGRPLVIAGLGQREALTAERLRRAAAAVAKQAVSLRQERVALALPERSILGALPSQPEEPAALRAALAMAEGAALAVYAFDRYRTDKKPHGLSTVTILAGSGAEAEDARKGTRLAQTIVEGTWLARDLANAPGNEIYPESLAAAARRSGREHGFRVTVLDERRLARLKMGGLLGVSRGSARPPRFIILEHGRAGRGQRTVVLVGKGVTFDSGGISIKPAANMAEMKMDMAGAAAVLGTVQTAARLDLPVHLVGLIPATENLPGGRALKPGDIIRHLNGKTSEIDNTDAEGRLILADALAFASRYRPAMVIDLATLTGAVVVALGHYATGMFGNNPGLMGRLKESGERTYERVWELPLYDEYDKLIKSDVADVKNVGGRWGGAITAAMFLKHFIGEYPWIHLDIAGTAIIEESLDYVPKGGSGVGVRLLTDFLRH